MEKKDFLFLIDLAPYFFSIQVYQISGNQLKNWHHNFIPIFDSNAYYIKVAIWHEFFVLP